MSRKNTKQKSHLVRFLIEIESGYHVTFSETLSRTAPY
jgi:hypothetical protein